MASKLVVSIHSAIPRANTKQPYILAFHTHRAARSPRVQIRCPPYPSPFSPFKTTHQSPAPAPYCGSPSLQAWLLVLLVVTGRSQSPFYIAGGILVLTVVSLPPRLWKAQIKRLGLLALFLYVTTALFAGQIFLPKYSPPPVLTFSLIWLVNVEPTRVKSKLESI